MFSEDMKAILSLMFVVFITGCGITGSVVQNIEQLETIEERDAAYLENALELEDISNCYKIQTQPIRESCFIALAQLTGDDSICKHLLGDTLRSACRDGVQ